MKGVLVNFRLPVILFSLLICAGNWNARAREGGGGSEADSLSPSEGEKVRVRGQARVGLTQDLAKRPPHPGPFPRSGGEGESSSAITRADSAWQKLRTQALNRQRRLIFNNDGNEPVYFCKSATEEDLLKLRTWPLAGSQVNSIFYCTWSSGFGMFTHNTKAGQVFNTQEAMFKENRTQEFLDRGIDPLRVIVEFGHKNKMEVFWSMRVNDTHDGARAEYGPVMFRVNKLKTEHPEYLIGTKEKPPKHGAWSAVDYGVPQIRELAFRYCEEVWQNYDVDGVELDFFRHAFLFRCSGRGEPCGEMELGQMTDLLRRVRTMTEAVGRKKGAPILLGVRAPDSIPYCKLIGLDLEKWLADGLLDLLIVSGYTQLNPWEYSVKLGHKYGVKVYPSLDEPRGRDEAANKLRASLETYRGRAMDAWTAGADGIYMFNFFDPHSALWRELGDPKILQRLDRNHFASVRGVGSMPVPHQKFINIPTLNPASPISITTNKPARVSVIIGASPDFSGQKAVLRMQFKKLDGSDQLRFQLNGQELKGGTQSQEWLEFELPSSSFSAESTLEISIARYVKDAPVLTDLYVAIAGK